MHDIAPDWWPQPYQEDAAVRRAGGSSFFANLMNGRATKIYGPLLSVEKKRTLEFVPKLEAEYGRNIRDRQYISLRGAEYYWNRIPFRNLTEMANYSPGQSRRGGL